MNENNEQPLCNIRHLFNMFNKKSSDAVWREGRPGKHIKHAEISLLTHP